jgi:hypothetical protein
MQKLRDEHLPSPIFLEHLVTKSTLSRYFQIS